jgi:hypothetical protein
MHCLGIDPCVSMLFIFENTIIIHILYIGFPVFIFLLALTLSWN